MSSSVVRCIHVLNIDSIAQLTHVKLKEKMLWREEQILDINLSCTSEAYITVQSKILKHMAFDLWWRLEELK